MKCLLTVAAPALVTGPLLAQAGRPAECPAPTSSSNKDGKTMAVDDWHQNSKAAAGAGQKPIAVSETGVSQSGNAASPSPAAFGINEQGVRLSNAVEGSGAAQGGQRAVSNPGVKRGDAPNAPPAALAKRSGHESAKNIIGNIRC